MFDRIRNEPAILYALVEAVIAFGLAIATSAGVEIAPEIIASFLGIVAIITGVGVRQAVYGPKTVDEIVDAEAVIQQAERG